MKMNILLFCANLQQCDASKSGYLSGAEIERFYELLTQRPEIDVIYSAYARTTGFMSAGDLQQFLVKEQREEEATLAHAHALIDKYEPDDKGGAFILKARTVRVRGHNLKYKYIFFCNFFFIEYKSRLKIITNEIAKLMK